MEPVPDPVEREGGRVRARHQPNGYPVAHCMVDGASWPCDVAVVAGALQARIESEYQRGYTQGWADCDDQGTAPK